MPAQFDHLVVGARTLEEGVREFARLTAVTAVTGGRHPGRGTENALVSLGPGRYLEIIAPQAGAQLSAEDERMRSLARLTILTWAISVNNIEEALTRLAEEAIQANPPRSGARVTPSGARLEWTTFTIAGLEGPAAPFFIHWSTGSAHPSATSPGGCAMTSLSVHHPVGGVLARALEALGVEDVVVRDGRADIVATLVGATGELQLDFDRTGTP